jgi:hypothetical protein
MLPDITTCAAPRHILPRCFDCKITWVISANPHLPLGLRLPGALHLALLVAQLVRGERLALARGELAPRDVARRKLNVGEAKGLETSFSHFVG